MSEKMQKCKTCGSDIAVKAKKCPSCGAKNKKPFYKKPILYIVILLVLVIAIASSGSNSNVTINYSNPDFTVSADDIIGEYSANSVSADEKYVDKVIEVSGKIASISENIIRIKGNNDENLLTDVSANLIDGQDDLIKQLITGNKITVVGVCKSTDALGDVKIVKAKIHSKKSKLTQSTSVAAQTETATEEQIKTIEVSIDTILQDYKDNSVTADDKYKGNKVKITDCIIFGVEDGFVQLENADAWDWTYVFAYYSSKDEIKNLKKGDHVTVSGVCRGEAILAGIKVTSATFE